MMSLTNVSTANIIKKQYIHKMTSYRDAWKSLIITQLIALAISSFSTGGGTTSGDFYSINVTNYSVDVVFFFTVFWAFIASFLVTTNSYTYEDFSYVSNRTTSAVSAILFVASITTIAAIFTMLSSYFIFMVMYLTQDVNILYGSNTIGDFSEILSSFAAVWGYLLLASSVGYIIGALVQISRIFSLVIPVLIFLPGFMNVQVPILTDVVTFFTTETSVMMFTMKVLITAILLFMLGWLLSAKKEVRTW
ncbi:hypothetical protein [Jeotgalibacillus sp. R-1-5s-1]|uniref:hypothetical protein n=1 Tax=Jeotgalibacillus sp. R-1-5s-1 TaxID=2555897 RepID=UPI00106B1969|nr:hypothetical protein [Jeotgalibacillus sp. R-1-5s-1]TFE02455.1 hypothetical protein E2491_02620 [Jeotgalibacillus sp. R-1-5s-1]